ncbi:hypothetical protein WJX77_011713 [Trebouxia sp. C0004]
MMMICDNDWAQSPGAAEWGRAKPDAPAGPPAALPALRHRKLQKTELQPLSMESKAAMALLEYLSPPPGSPPRVPLLPCKVIETLSISSHIEPWAARAGGLVFAQYFWFRHCFLLTAHQGEAVQQLVVSMLSDRKLEVQDQDAASLSGAADGLDTPASLGAGLLKGTTPAPV